MSTSREARALLAAVVADDLPTHDDTARNRDALMRKLGYGAVVSIAAAAASKASAKAAVASGTTAGATVAGAGGVKAAALGVGGLSLGVKLVGAGVVIASASALGAVGVQSAAPPAEATRIVAPSHRPTEAWSTLRAAAAPASALPAAHTQEVREAPSPARPAAASRSVVVVRPAAKAPEAAAPTRASASAPTSVAAAETRTTSSAPPPVSERRPEAPSEAVAEAPKPEPVASTLAEETALLREAELALARGDVTKSRGLLDQHARRYPKGILAEEREAERVIATCAQGKSASALATADAFVRAHPSSVLSARVRRSCASR